MARILVVDDSFFARLRICNILKELGHETLEAENGREALEVALAHRPDCIFSDLLMPEVDGIGFLASLREVDADVPVVILTADIQNTKREQCLSLGAFGFLHKPPQQKELQGVIEKALNSGRQES